jgi:hypothetical protein
VNQPLSRQLYQPVSQFLYQVLYQVLCQLPVPVMQNVLMFTLALRTLVSMDRVYTLRMMQHAAMVYSAMGLKYVEPLGARPGLRLTRRVARAAMNRLIRYLDARGQMLIYHHQATRTSRLPCAKILVALGRISL